MSQTLDTQMTMTRVLVADDDDALRALVTQILRADGYYVEEVCDGIELLEQLTETLEDPFLRPDVVLTDVRMPRLSGLGVLEALYKARTPIPVLVMTIFGDESIRTVARRFGAVGVLNKPFDADDLRTAVMNAQVAFARMTRQLGGWVTGDEERTGVRRKNHDLESPGESSSGEDVTPLHRSIFR